MSRKFFKFFGRDEIIGLMALISVFLINVYIVYSAIFRSGYSLEERTLVGILFVGSLLWLRMEIININKPSWDELNDHLDYKNDQ